MTLKERIEDIKKTISQSNKGPWTIKEGEIGCRNRDNPDPDLRCDCYGYGIIGADNTVVCMPDNVEHIVPAIHDIKDALFIAKSRADLPWAIEKLEAAIKVIEFYADEKNWEWNNSPSAGTYEYRRCVHDRGSEASEFLKEIEK